MFWLFREGNESDGETNSQKGNTRDSWKGTEKDSWKGTERDSWKGTERDSWKGTERDSLTGNDVIRQIDGKYIGANSIASIFELTNKYV